MTTLGTIVLFVAGFVLLGGILKKLRAGRIGKTPFAAPGQIALNGKQLADAKGSIATEGHLRHGQLLTSPVSQTPCLFYKLSVEAEWKVGDSSKKVTIVDDAQAIPFSVSDASGEVGVTVDPKNSSDIVSAKPFDGKGFSRGLLGQMTAKPLEITPAFSIPATVHYTEMGKQWEVPSNAKFIVTEHLLEPKPFLHVNGKLLDDGSIGSPKWTNLLISEKTRDALLADSLGMAKKLFIGGGVGALAGAVVMVIGLLTASPKVAKSDTLPATNETTTTSAQTNLDPSEEEHLNDDNDDLEAAEVVPAKTK